MIKFAMIRLMAARLAGEELSEPCTEVEKEAARRLGRVSRILWLGCGRHHRCMIGMT
jgi:hypothetical protein